jgi:hypothetical protein
MSEKTSNASGGGIGLLGALFLVLTTLKLLGKITMSWLWVTAPLWGGLALAAAILVVLAIVVGIMALVDR